LAAEPSIGRAARVEGTRAPEADLTRALYEQYGNQIFRYCLHQLGSREEAEDAVQSTFLNAFRGIKRGIVPELESAWLFKIAQNVCLSRRRSTWRRDRIESPTDFELVEELTPAPPRRADELMGLQDVLEQMPENQRRAILLREWQGLSYHEIAGELELSQAAVETLIFRARRALAQGLEQPPAPKKRRLARGADWGNVLAGLKSLLLGGGAAIKVAATVAVVSATTVVAAAPVVEHHSRPHTTPAVAAPTPTAAVSRATAAATGLTANRAGGVPALARRHAAKAARVHRAPAPSDVAAVSPAADTAVAATPPVEQALAPAPAAPAPAPAPAATQPASGSGGGQADTQTVVAKTPVEVKKDDSSSGTPTVVAASTTEPTSSAADSSSGTAAATTPTKTPVEVKKDDSSSGTPTVVAASTTEPTSSAADSSSGTAAASSSGTAAATPTVTPTSQQAPVVAPVTTTLNAPPAGDNASSPALVLPPTVTKKLDSAPGPTPASTPAASLPPASTDTPVTKTLPPTQSVPPSTLPVGSIPPSLTVQPPATTTGHGTVGLSGASTGLNH
jgi:RNA polymerase sigma factor (sigma-70 family)